MCVPVGVLSPEESVRPSFRGILCWQFCCGEESELRCLLAAWAAVPAGLHGSPCWGTALLLHTGQNGNVPFGRMHPALQKQVYALHWRQVKDLEIFGALWGRWQPLLSTYVAVWNCSGGNECCLSPWLKCRSLPLWNSTLSGPDGKCVGSEFPARQTFGPSVLQAE